MKTPKPHAYDEREIAFLRGEPMADDWDEFEEDYQGGESSPGEPHGYECECEACLGCESYQYIYFPNAPRPWWMWVAEGGLVGFLVGTVVGVALRWLVG